MNHKYIFLSGLPRSGSNMLSSILNQNPEIHSEGISSLCRFLWNTHDLIENNISLKEEMLATHRFNEKNIKNIFYSLADGYYWDVDKKIIIDKNFSWTTKENLEMIQKYFSNNYKIIVLERNIKDVVISLKNIYIKNGFNDLDSERYIFSSGNPLMRPISSLIWAKINKNDNFIFIDYDNFIINSEYFINKISNFIGSDFKYDLKNITLKFPEDQKYTAKEFMEVRTNISKRFLDVQLSSYAEKKIKEINDIIFLASQSLIEKNDFYNILKFYEKGL